PLSRGVQELDEAARARYIETVKAPRANAYQLAVKRYARLGWAALGERVLPVGVHKGDSPARWSFVIK
ncbi:MAG: hypothetical protein ACREOS_01655, partial [Candidatus Dormibacteraceae bacterium]